MARWQAAVVGVIALSTERLQRLTREGRGTAKAARRTKPVIAEDSRGPTAAVVRSISAAGIDAAIAGECQ